MKRCIRDVLVVICIGVLMVCNCLVAYADFSSSVDIDATLDVPKNNAQIANICSEANNSLSNSVDILSYSTSGDSALLKFDNSLYSSLDSDEKKIFMEAALGTTAKSGLNAKTKNSVYNFIAGQDTPVTNAMKYLKSDANADFLEAKKFFDPWASVLGAVIGVMCVAIFMFAGFSILFDIMYLVLPGMQFVCESLSEVCSSKLSEVGIKTVENPKPFGVSREAYTALKDSENSPTYKNVMSIYLRRRLGLLLVMAICMGYLISGKIFDVLTYFIDAFSI